MMKTLTTTSLAAKKRKKKYPLRYVLYIILQKPKEMSKNAPSFQPKAGAKPGPPTHFLSLPVTTKNLCKKLVDFQYKVEGFDKGRSVREEWYTEQKTFNFTLARLPLDTKERQKQAVEVLTDLQPEIEEFLDSKKLHLNIKGVADFKINDKESQILFAKLANNKSFDTLVELVGWIIDKLISAEVIESHEVKKEPFHLTLINSALMKPQGHLRGFNGK